MSARVLKAGNGPKIDNGQCVRLHVRAAECEADLADDEAVVMSTYADSSAIEVSLQDDRLLADIRQALVGAQVGSTILIQRGGRGSVGCLELWIDEIVEEPLDIQDVRVASWVWTSSLSEGGEVDPIHDALRTALRQHVGVRVIVPAALHRRFKDEAVARALDVQRAAPRLLGEDENESEWLLDEAVWRGWLASLGRSRR